MKKLSLTMSLILLSIGLMGCQQNKSEQEDTSAEIKQDDFIYRLVTEKSEYEEGEPVKIYAELEYIGDQEEIEIGHAASPFFFPMVETTRNFEIDYRITEPFSGTKLVKGEPHREEYRGGGGYGSEDSDEFIDFTRQILKQEFPEGDYVVKGVAKFSVFRANEESEQVKNYNIKAQIEFRVKNRK